MGLLDLPAEIYLRIFEDDDLIMDDYKALRLTTRAFYPSSTAVIFRRVPISKTKKDWNRFRDIASSPHLAECVREVAWYELIEDHRILCHSQGMQEGCWCEEKASEKFPITAHELAPLAKDIFWLSPEICEARDGTELTDLKKQFLSLIYLLPNLESFVSLPMPPSYILSKGPYVFTAQLFYRCLGLTGPGFSRHSISPGFFHFLAPAILQQPSKIRRLHFIDHPSRSAIYNFTDPQSPVFEKLTYINLSLNLVGHSGDLVSCMWRARNLEWLRICIDRPGPIPVLQAMASLFDPSPTRYWPRITTLELVRVSTSPSKVSPRWGGPMFGEIVKARRTFLALLDAHSPTLRNLTMQECDIHREVVQGMAGIQGLNLKSFRVVASEEGKTEWVDEQELLAFVNGVDKSGRCVRDLRDGKVFNTFSTAVNTAVQEYQGAFASDVWDNAVPPTVDDNDTFRPRKNNSYGQSVYARDKREEGAPKWKFGQADNGIYFWPSDEKGARETRHWRFTHRNGEVAFGDEPLDFFSDWDSDSESGDVAEAVPTGGLFSKELNDARSDLIEDKEIPEGATKYDNEEYTGFGAADCNCARYALSRDESDRSEETDESDGSDETGFDEDGFTIAFWPMG